MSDASLLFFTAVAGALLGVLNAFALFWALRTMHRTRRPRAFLLATFPIRLALTLAPLLFVAGGELRRLLAGIALFIVARWLTVRGLDARMRSSSKEVAP